MTKINARNKGLNYERRIVQELKELLSLENIGTTRNLNRYKDSLKIDIELSPFSIQCKALETTPSYHKILSEMPQDNNYNVIFHKKNRLGEVVVMDKKSFYDILAMLKFNGII